MQETLSRAFQLETRTSGNGQIVASLASDHPCERSFGTEVLDFNHQSVDLTRARDGLPLLAGHDRDKLIGRVHGIQVSGRRLLGKLEFFDTQPGRDHKTMVKAGHREVSIGYEIGDMVRDGNVFRVTRWTPFEVSIVSVPADPTIGINRSRASTGEITMQETTTTTTTAADESSTLSRSQRAAANGAARAEAERVESIRKTGEAYSKWVSPADTQRAIDKGESVGEFNAYLMGRMQSGATDISMPYGLVQSRQHDPYAGFSLGRSILAQVDPSTFLRTAGREAELSREMSRSAPMQLVGSMVPFGAMFGASAQHRALSAGASTLGGSTVPTGMAVDQFADVLRAKSVCVLMGARTLTGLSEPVNIPRKTAGTTAAWLTETGTASSSDVNTDNLLLTPRRISAYVDVSRQLLITSGLAVESMIREDLSMGILLELDRVGMLGTGASNQPRGIANTSGIGPVVGGTNGAQLTWSHVLGLESAVAAANGIFNNATTGYAINAATRSWAKKTLKVSGVGTDLIMDDTPVDLDGTSRLNGYRTMVSSLLPNNGTKGTSTSVCSTLIFGDWSQLVVAQFGPGVEIIVDPYSLATTGQVRITANLFADIGVRYASSFAAMSDALTV